LALDWVSVDHEEKSAQRRSAGLPKISRSSHYVQVVQEWWDSAGGAGLCEWGGHAGRAETRSPAQRRADSKHVSCQFKGRNIL